MQPTKAQRLKAYFQSHEPGDAEEALAMIGEIEDNPLMKAQRQGWKVEFDDGSVFYCINHQHYTDTDPDLP